MIIIFKLILFFIFLLLVAYFAGIETSITSLSTVSLTKLKNKYGFLSGSISYWESKPNELIASVLIGTNLFMIGAGVLGTSIALDMSERYPGYASILIAVIPVIATILVLLLGEIGPKIFSRYMAENVAVWGLPFLVNVNSYLVPVTRLILKISEGFIGVFSKNIVRETPFLKQDELKLLLLSDDTSPIPKSQRNMVNKIFDLTKTRINHIMVPREQMHAVDIGQDPKLVINQIIQKGYSRIPVYRGDIDNIAGIIYSKDLNFALRGEALVLVEDLIRPAYFIPETARIDKVLREFKTGHHHMGVVVNEFGSVAGVVTIEDIVEEIVGEIWDEYDIQKKTIFPLPDGFYVLKANESVDRVNEELKLNLPSGEFTTIGGWVLEVFGKIPKIGESIRYNDIEVVIVDASRKRINKVKVKKHNRKIE